MTFPRSSGGMMGIRAQTLLKTKIYDRPAVCGINVYHLASAGHSPTLIPPRLFGAAGSCG